MTRYRGHILALLLTMICMWINVYRYPCVREMVEGKYVPQARSTSSEPTKEPAKESETKFQTPSRTWFPRKMQEAPKEPKGVVAEQERTGPFRNVSSEPKDTPRARAPLPVVPRRDQSNPGRERTSLNESRDDADHGNVFHDAIWSRPVPEEDSESEEESKSSGHEESEVNSGGPSTVYRAVGAPGTCPLDGESPSYAPASAYTL
ncbi:MAG: hypothetical protein Q4G68_09455 [Planctomycetia bacterium]|nr:hypothetical protein [Planctomycetia bacterium]